MPGIRATVDILAMVGVFCLFHFGLIQNIKSRYRVKTVFTIARSNPNFSIQCAMKNPFCAYVHKHRLAAQRGSGALDEESENEIDFSR